MAKPGTSAWNSGPVWWSRLQISEIKWQKTVIFGNFCSNDCFVQRAEDDQELTVTAGEMRFWWRGSLSPAAHFSDESECCESLQAFVEVKITEHNDIEICKRISHRHCFLGGEVGKGVDQSASQILTSNVRNQNRTEINLHLESWHRMYGTRIVQKYKKTHWNWKLS